jgi:hypothetical protein
MLLIMVGAFALSFSLEVWNFIQIRNTPASHACVSNLRIIQGATEQWALENHKTSNDAPTVEDIRPYMGRGGAGEIPVCPQGGIYTPGRLGQPPTCSIGGPQHSLNYDYSKENMYSTLVLSLFWLSFIGLLVALFLPKKMNVHDRGATA